MKQYLGLMEQILEEGRDRPDRTGTGVRGIFGAQLRFDLTAGFPALTTKKLHLRSIINELLWFLSGSTQVAPLQEAGVRIWNDWATAEECARFGREAGNLGPVYGHQWRNFGATLRPDGAWEDDGVDQIARVVDSLQTNPYSRRHIVSAWHPGESDQVTLPPCHTLFQFHVQDDELRCQLYQRSADYFLGVPFNIASYALLTHMIARVTGLRAVEFVHTFGDVHLYLNHLEQAQLQLTRAPRALPTLAMDPDVTSLSDFRYKSFSLQRYDPHPHIKAAVSV